MEFQALLVLAFAAYVQAGQWVYVEDPGGKQIIKTMVLLATE